jgi:hypothetical protein
VELSDGEWGRQAGTCRRGWGSGVQALVTHLHVRCWLMSRWQQGAVGQGMGCSSGTQVFGTQDDRCRACWRLAAADADAVFTCAVSCGTCMHAPSGTLRSLHVVSECHCCVVSCCAADCLQTTLMTHPLPSSQTSPLLSKPRLVSPAPTQGAHLGFPPSQQVCIPLLVFAAG